MARIRDVKDQRNTWGSAGDDAPNAQRADLWQVDLQSVVTGLNQQITDTGVGLNFLPEFNRFLAQSVSLPELKVGSAEYRRDSRPFLMPVFDEPLGPFSIKFLMDSPTDSKSSKIYRLLDTWRAAVRAGRGGMGNEASMVLNSDYRIDFTFNIALTLLRGTVNLQAAATSDGVTPSPDLAINNDLEVCGQYTLNDVWLSSFKVGDLTYTTGNQLVIIDAQFVAGNLADVGV